MKTLHKFAYTLPLIGLMGAMAAWAQQPTTGPIARYDMRAGTNSGMKPGMGMIMGGGPSTSHELLLRLGSSQTPNGAPPNGTPKADHFMPTGALLGPSVPLVTPQDSRGPVGESEDGFPENRRPKGRLLIYWGCGEHAGPGQPVIIDFAKLAAGQVPQGVWTSAIPRDYGPTIANSRTYGRWPNNDGKTVKPNASLLGDHRIVGNYAPTISFRLTRDFMGPLTPAISTLPSGAKLLQWSSLPDATGYLATMFGGQMGRGGDMQDMVMWSSSATRQFGGGLSDWLTPAQVAGLVRERTALPPSATQCAIPAEAIRDAGQFRAGTLTAWGPMEDFAYPARPANPKQVWAIEWTARIRHRSFAQWMDMPGMGQMGARGDAPPAPQSTDAPPPAKCKPKKAGLGALGGMLGGIGGAIATAAGGGC